MSNSSMNRFINSKIFIEHPLCTGTVLGREDRGDKGKILALLEATCVLELLNFMRLF